MAFKVFTVGEIFTASDANTMLMKQVVIVCTSGTRPASPVEGMTIYETDTDRLLIWDGAAWVPVTSVGAWTTYVPAWTSTGTAPAIGNGTITGASMTHGKTTFVRGQITMGSTTTFGTGTYSVSVPTAATAGSQAQTVGVTFYLDSGTAQRGGMCIFGTSTTMQLITAAGGDVTNTVPHTWANTDRIYWSVTYEIA